MPCEDCQFLANDAEQRKVLRLLFTINFTMFLSELVVGIIAQSTGVLADSIDMLADALIYGISLFAVGKATGSKNLAARLSGIFQIAIALAIAGDIARRAYFGSEPASVPMLVVSSVALMANIYCLRMIASHRDGGIHMRASWIFSKNDVIANVGVIVAALLVAVTNSRWPDLVIGAIITLFVLRGGISILQEAAAERNTRQPH